MYTVYNLRGWDAPPGVRAMSWYNSISLKIILSVVGMVLVVNGALAYLYLNIQKQNLNHAILRNASQLSETIRKSIQNDMLENRKEAAYKIMETIGQQEGIEKVRVYSSDGKILFSTDKHEAGRMVDKHAEACYRCHAEKRPIERLATSERSRIFLSAGDEEKGAVKHRVLGIINPMYNEAGCSDAKCHAHPESTKVLGVIDVTMDLSEVDVQIARVRNQVLLVSVVSIFAIGIIVALILYQFIERPIQEMVLGTKRISGGDLDHLIPVATKDEMGHLAGSFNQMTLDLKEAQEKIQEGIHTLEQNVEDRTRELRETQAQLLHSEKLAAIGSLAATVAHEINNPLTGIYTYIKLIERKLGQGQYGPEDIEKYRSYLDTSRREVERTTAIVQNLLDFTRPKEPTRKALNLVGIIEDCLAMLQNKLSLNNIKVSKQITPLPDLQADPAHMKQVFINLLVNACEAMENGGTLTIQTGYDPSEGTVSVVVSDTGVGIDRENLKKIFDPFFSTKEKGTGLGLSVVQGIIKRHNGQVEIDSTPGRGTDFRVILPLS